MSIYLEINDGKSNKFWEGGFEIDTNELTFRYGKIGTKGQFLIKKYDSLDSLSQIMDELNKAVEQKLKEGYKEIGYIIKKTSISQSKEADEKKSIEQVLNELYDDNLNLFQKGYFEVQYKDHDFRIYQVDGSYQGSFQTLIHYILFNEKLYDDYFSPKSVKVATRVFKNSPDLPPAFDGERESDLFDEFVYDATEFTYQYLKVHKLYCEEMNDWIISVGSDLKLLKKSKLKY